MNQKIIGVGLALATLFVAVTPTFAQSPSSNPRSEWQIEKRCFVAQNRIEQRVETYRKNRDNHITRYNKMKDRLTTLVNKLTGKGYDTAKLKADLVVLDGKIQKFAADSAAFHKKLEEANDYNCGDSEGAFKSRVEEARDLLKIVRADAKDIWDYFKNTIKPDFQALRGSKPSPSPSPSV